MSFRRCARLITIAAVVVLGSSDVGAAQTTEEEQALVLARRAAHRFQAGDFGTASTLLREAITLHERPALHINLARTLSRLERWHEARDSYVRYLELEPDGERRVEVEEAIRELDEQINGPARVEAPEPSEAAAPVPPVEDDPVAPVARPRRNITPWIVLGAGVLVGAAGIPLTIVSGDAADRARSAMNQQEAERPASDARTYAITADVLYAVGGAIVLTGLVWGLLTREDRDPSVSLQVYPGGAGLSGHF